MKYHRWFAHTGAKPLFPFGYGLTYTSFRYDGLKVAGGDTVRFSFTLTNTGARAGTEIAQAYLDGRAGADPGTPGRLDARDAQARPIAPGQHCRSDSPARQLERGGPCLVGGGRNLPRVAVGPNAGEVATHRRGQRPRRAPQSLSRGAPGRARGKVSAR